MRVSGMPISRNALLEARPLRLGTDQADERNRARERCCGERKVQWMRVRHDEDERVVAARASSSANGSAARTGVTFAGM